MRTQSVEEAVERVVTGAERQSHYFEALPAEQVDLLIHLDQTRALEPLERESLWEEDEVPETYPTAL